VSKFNGQDVPWTGNPDADMASPKKIDDNSYENTWKKGGKTTMIAKAVVSADGKTLNITQTGTDAKGQAVSNTVIYDRSSRGVPTGFTTGARASRGLVFLAAGQSGENGSSGRI
jgi:hypothetical protein